MIDPETKGPDAETACRGVGKRLKEGKEANKGLS